jgi:hypothetical protein
MPYARWSNGVQTRRFPFSLSLSLCLIVEEARRKNYKFFIIFLGREFASLLHAKSPSSAHVALLGLSPESLMARRTCLTLYYNIHILKEYFVQVKFFFESSKFGLVGLCNNSKTKAYCTNIGLIRTSCSQTTRLAFVAYRIFLNLFSLIFVPCMVSRIDRSTIP